METKKEKSFAMGILGALVGSLLGAASIVLLAQAGVISAISGFILAFCTLKGFELLGGKLETKSIIVCVVIMAVVPYFADRVAWAWALVEEFGEVSPELGLTFGDCFKYVHEFIAQADLANGTNEATMGYIKNIVFVYVFTALGAYTIVKQTIKQKDAIIEEAPVEEIIEEAPVEE